MISSRNWVLYLTHPCLGLKFLCLSSKKMLTTVKQRRGFEKIRLINRMMSGKIPFQKRMACWSHSHQWSFFIASNRSCLSVSLKWVLEFTSLAACSQPPALVKSYVTDSCKYNTQILEFLTQFAPRKWVPVARCYLIDLCVLSWFVYSRVPCRRYHCIHRYVHWY